MKYLKLSSLFQHIPRAHAEEYFMNAMFNISAYLPDLHRKALDPY